MDYTDCDGYLALDQFSGTALLCRTAYDSGSYYQAAAIDGAGRWAIFRHIQLPKLRLVLLIAGLLRFMDSFIIYTEAYVLARGGPGVSTNFLSKLIQTATIQFDLGEGRHGRHLLRS